MGYGKMQRRAWPFVAVVFLVTLGRYGVSAAHVIDQQQPTIDTSVGGLAIGGQSQEKLAQVVTTGISGVLTEVRLPLGCDSGDLIVEIQGAAAGIPDGVVLTSETFPASALPPVGAVFRSLPFSVPVSFSVGDLFAIVLRSTGDCGVFQGPIGDPYPGGNAFFDARPNPPGWVCFCEFPGAFDLPFQTVVATETPPLQVGIDIKPGGSPNTVNPRSQGKIAVAILSSPTFDAPSEVDTTSLTFGRTGDEASLAFCRGTEDVNGDNLPDLICHFNTQATGFLLGDTLGVLKGETLSGVPIQGTDSVRILK